MYPSRSFHMNSQPRSWISRSTYERHLQPISRPQAPRGWAARGSPSAPADMRHQREGPPPVPPVPICLPRTHVLQATAEPLKDPLHVATLLHGDDAGMVLLVHPHQEALLVVVPGQGGPSVSVAMCPPQPSAPPTHLDLPPDKAPGRPARARLQPRLRHAPVVCDHSGAAPGGRMWAWHVHVCSSAHRLPDSMGVGSSRQRVPRPWQRG